MYCMRRMYRLRPHTLHTCHQVHGLNGVLALLELCLNELPALFALSGFMDLWLCAYVVFNLMHYVRFGR